MSDPTTTWRPVTAAEVVRVLKTSRRRLRAAHLAYMLGSTSRGIATALRGPVRDKRVTVTWSNGVATYGVARSTPKAKS